MNADVPTFHAPWWLKNPHAQTLFPYLFRQTETLKHIWKRIELHDGDFIDTVWESTSFEQQAWPIVVLLHGLGGSVHSSYIRGMMARLKKRKVRPVLMHFRGSSGVPNRLARGYHSGETGDLAFFVDKLKKEQPNAAIFAIGFSLGGNVLLKWLGETQSTNPLTAAAAVSVPFELAAVANRLMTGASRMYQWSILGELIANMKIKAKTVEYPFEINMLQSIHNFWQFDDQVTAKLFGYRDVHDYYKKCSSRQFLPDITTPTLIIHSLDDPFMNPDVVPKPSELGPKTTLSLSKAGGHVGFIQGSIPGKHHYWLEEIIPNFLENIHPSS